jgi:hypothetical protein
VTTLRSQPVAVRLVDGDHQPAWTVRVQCAEAWDAVRVELTPSTRVLDVKRAAMSVLMPDVDDIGEHVVKLNGFEIIDERQSLEAAGALDGSTLLIMSRRRRAVR